MAWNGEERHCNLDPSDVMGLNEGFILHKKQEACSLITISPLTVLDPVGRPPGSRRQGL